jgi:hypothetical protein
MRFDLLPDFLDARKAARLGTIARENVHAAAWQIAAGDNFRKDQRGSGLVLDANTIAVFPLRITGAINETSARSAGSSGQMTTTTPVGSGMVKLKCELATGFTEQDLTELISPSRVMHQSIDRERGSRGRQGRSSRDNGISKIFAGSAAIIGNQRAAGSARWKDATVFSAHKLAANVQFVGLLNLELPLCCHESRIAQWGEKENAKPQQSIS